MQVNIKISKGELMYRMRGLIPLLFNVEQQGFNSGRSPHHHVRFLSDLQLLLTESDFDGLAVSFDRMDWTYTFKYFYRWDMVLVSAREFKFSAVTLWPFLLSMVVFFLRWWLPVE